MDRAIPLSSTELNAVWDKGPSRVHIVGTVIVLENHENWRQGMIDDGSGTVEFRLFTSSITANIGDHARIIGRPKTFGSSKYIAIDLLKRIEDSRWIEVWHLEREKKSSGSVQQIKAVIRELDDGTGAAIEDVLARSDAAERTIERLKECGEVFETRPGRLKLIDDGNF